MKEIVEDGTDERRSQLFTNISHGSVATLFGYAGIYNGLLVQFLLSVSVKGLKNVLMFGEDVDGFVVLFLTYGGR